MNAISRFTSAITSGPIPSPGSSKSVWVAIGSVLQRNAGRSLKRWTHDLQAARGFRARHTGRLFAAQRVGADPTRTVINFAMAIIFGIVYHLMGLAHPWTWALITAVLLYVPYLGPILAGIPPTLDAFVSCESPWMAVGLLVFYTAFIKVGLTGSELGAGWRLQRTIGLSRAREALFANRPISSVVTTTTPMTRRTAGNGVRTK